MHANNHTHTHTYDCRRYYPALTHLSLCQKVVPLIPQYCVKQSVRRLKHFKVYLFSVMVSQLGGYFFVSFVPFGGTFNLLSLSLSPYKRAGFFRRVFLPSFFFSLKHIIRAATCTLQHFPYFLIYMELERKKLA